MSQSNFKMDLHVRMQDPELIALRQRVLRPTTIPYGGPTEFPETVMERGLAHMRLMTALLIYLRDHADDKERAA